MEVEVRRMLVKCLFVYEGLVPLLRIVTVCELGMSVGMNTLCTREGWRDKKDIKKERDDGGGRRIKENRVERTKDSRGTVFGNKEAEIESQRRGLVSIWASASSDGKEIFRDKDEGRILELHSPDGVHECWLRAADNTEANVWFNALHSALAALTLKALRLASALPDPPQLQHIGWLARRHCLQVVMLVFVRFLVVIFGKAEIPSNPKRSYLASTVREALEWSFEIAEFYNTSLAIERIPRQDNPYAPRNRKKSGELGEIVRVRRAAWRVAGGWRLGWKLAETDSGYEHRSRFRDPDRSKSNGGLRLTDPNSTVPYDGSMPRVPRGSIQRSPSVPAMFRDPSNRDALRTSFDNRHRSVHVVRWCSDDTERGMATGNRKTGNGPGWSAIKRQFCDNRDEPGPLITVGFIRVISVAAGNVTFTRKIHKPAKPFWPRCSTGLPAPLCRDPAAPPDGSGPNIRPDRLLNNMRTEFLDQRPINHIGKQGTSGLINAPVYSCSVVRRTSYCKLDFCNEFRGREQWTGVAIIRLVHAPLRFPIAALTASPPFFVVLENPSCLPERSVAIIGSEPWSSRIAAGNSIETSS
ncbi:Syntrophin-1 [Eufriesea mexicana]|nr:Syntrophin-1 [Eufriesea mexicana]